MSVEFNYLLNDGTKILVNAERVGLCGFRLGFFFNPVLDPTYTLIQLKNAMEDIEVCAQSELCDAEMEEKRNEYVEVEEYA